MNFIIENISKSSGRLGKLVHSETGKQFGTPFLLQTTKGGSIPYLSRDVFDHVTKDDQILQMSLATMDHMADALSLYKANLAAYVGFKDYPTMLTIRDPCEIMPSGMNDKDMVPLFTRRGKEQLTTKKYMDLVEIFKPDMYQGLCDADTNLESSKKRVQKSVDRSAQFMNYCYERYSSSDHLKRTALFAPIVGGYNTYARSESIQHAMSKADNIFSGFIFEGFHNYGLSATEIDVDKLLDIMRHSLKEIGDDKPKMMLGAYTPLVVLELISLGVDMFDSSYAYCAAINFKALIFNFDLSAKTTTESAFLDLTDEKFKDEFNPLVENCICLACQKHTRAYVHHLYKTNELLGPILLMIHNLHHYMKFFEAIRSNIAKDSLPQLISLIKFQTTETEIDYHIEQNKKEINKVGLVKVSSNPNLIKNFG